MTELEEKELQEIEELRLRDPKFVHEENELVVQNYQMKEEVKSLRERIAELEAIIKPMG